MADKNEKQKIFREQSLEKYSNPEKLNDYLRVTSPGVWLLLATVIVILAGVCIWGVLGRINATSKAAVVTENGKSVCFVPTSALKGVIENHTVRIEGENWELIPAAQEPQTISESTNIYMVLAGGFSVGDIVYPVNLREPLPDDGIVSGEVLTETISPIALFFDR